MYKVVTIELIDDVELESDITFYRYVIKSNKSMITGCRHGTESEVRNFVEFFVGTLNQKYKSSTQSEKIYKPVVSDPFYYF